MSFMEDEITGQPPDDVNAINIRQSIHNIKNKLHVTFGDDLDDSEGDRHWSLSHLKKIFNAEEEIQDLFELYIRRLHQTFFSLLMLIQSGIFSIHFFAIIIFSDNLRSNILDLICYSLMACLSIKLFCITDGCGYTILKDGALKFITLAVFLLLHVVNFLIPLYYYLSDAHIQLRPAYSTHIIISCYVFLFISNKALNLTMGIFSTIAHLLILVFITYNHLSSSILRSRVLSDTLYLLCINGLGIYYRYLNEIIKRKSFLDRRQCVIFNRHLKFQKEQEELLMDTLVPSYVMNNVRENIFLYWKAIDNLDSSDTVVEYKTSFTQTFDNVSILFADVVNYTEMTVKLKTSELVETLNELFGKFDDVSMKYQVMRIKFLGDCYYCAAGLPPEPPENHAEACVDLGLEMIKIISEVRNRRNVNINMRIGIHTGKIISGIIGYQKIHFDIWSKDVSLANQMETEGEAGKVHITQQTKNLLRKKYQIEMTEKGETVPEFRKLRIKTYLITPEIEKNSMDRKNEIANIYVKKKHSNLLSNKRTSASKTASKTVKTLSNVNENNNNNITDPNNPHMQNSNEQNVKSYGLIESTYLEEGRQEDKEDFPHRRTTDDKHSGSSNKNDFRDSERRTAFMNSNIKRYQDTMKETYGEMKQTIESLSLTKYQQWFEFREINPVTLLFTDLKRELNFVTMKDYLFKYYLVSGVILMIILYIIQNLTLSEWNWQSWWIFSSLAIMIFVFVPLMWMNYFIKDKNCKLSRVSIYATKSLWVRLFIYTSVCFLFTCCVFSEIIHCRINYTTVDGKNLDKNLEKSFLLLLANPTSSEHYGICIVPWHMTQTCALAIIMSFIFLRMLLWIKFIYGVLITTLYAACVWYFSDDILKTDSETFNYNMSPKVSHILSVIFLTFTLHIIDRQTEYMNRLDFLWNEKLKEEKLKTESRYIVNKMLLNNVLPEHLAKMYLNIKRPPAALYHENYTNAAVMFASVVGYQMKNIEDDVLLAIMSEVIGEFDKILIQGYGMEYPIEKIKVAKWTYMAACGISPGSGDVDGTDPANYVEALLKFASAMMIQLGRLNQKHSQNLKLRVGISNGEIVAGVVGSKKPLYDIWGDPVNMASRMDTTGEPNKIHVLERTAKVIQAKGYKCTLRGNTVVKGLKGPVPTYFIDMNERFELERTNS